MASHMRTVSSQQRICTIMHLPEELQFHKRKWYFSRQEIEDCSPSRKDGIDLEKESQQRKLYCSFIQELGKKLKVPQVTIACALMLCHRFYMCQSHAKNDWKTIATACIFLACKLEETPRLLRDVVVVAYEIMHEWDPSAAQRIRKIEFCNKQKELIATGERLLLVTIAFDLDIQLPYRPLVDALKKLQMYPDLAKVAWNFVNDWLCTTLCLQYKPHYIAAGSMFLAAKFQKVKLPTEKGKVWWLEFDIAPKQLEEVIQQMVRLLEQDRKQAVSLTDGSVAQSGASVGKTLVSSSQSTITSVSMANSHSSNGDVMDSITSSERNICLKEVLLCKTRDNFASSIVEDGDGKKSRPRTGQSVASSIVEDGAGKKSQPRTGQSGLSSNYNIVPVHSSLGKIDADRIREALKRRRCKGAANEIPNEAMNTEIDCEAWIERELEKGIELETAPLEYKRRKVG